MRQNAHDLSGSAFCGSEIGHLVHPISYPLHSYCIAGRHLHVPEAFLTLASWSQTRPRAPKTTHVGATVSLNACRIKWLHDYVACYGHRYVVTVH
jgi:hypothetical protein